MSVNLLPFVFVLFGLGLFCLLTRRSLVKLLIGLELLGKATTLAIIWAGVVRGTPATTQSIALLVISIEALVVAVYLALVYAFHRHNQSLDTDDMRRLKG
ncbi:MAG: NADH-quinone oxidoreductase subunit K [Coprothermobacterota bacterium]|nr:NADH-quinone oxidoreductase subunit K [Coprothermobacterota bacterium]